MLQPAGCQPLTRTGRNGLADAPQGDQKRSVALCKTAWICASDCIFMRVRDKQALRPSSGSSHVETQNFASGIVSCIHFYGIAPSQTQNFASPHVADSRPETYIFLPGKRKSLFRARVCLCALLRPPEAGNPSAGNEKPAPSAVRAVGAGERISAACRAGSGQQPPDGLADGLAVGASGQLL